jgi:DNA-binding winged helix-turn-helix (wHTH) protein
MIYCFGSWELDIACQELRRTGQIVAIEPKVFQALLYLLQHRDRVVTKDELLEACWPGTMVMLSSMRIRKNVYLRGSPGAAGSTTQRLQIFRKCSAIGVNASGQARQLEKWEDRSCRCQRW